MERLMGFFAGMGAGIAAGLLFAPRAGNRTRAILRKRAAESAEYIRQRGNEAKDAAAEKLREGSWRVARETEAVRTAVEAGRRAYSQSRP